MFFKKFLRNRKLNNSIQEMEQFVITFYRQILCNMNINNSEIKDSDILDIYKSVLSKFREASAVRGEYIDVDNINRIVLHFLFVYSQFGRDFYEENFEYELDCYKNFGLRDNYKEGLSFFN